jgi:hypothetical protein
VLLKALDGQTASNGPDSYLLHAEAYNAAAAPREIIRVAAALAVAEALAIARLAA